MIRLNHLKKGGDKLGRNYFAKVGINKYFGLTVNEWLDLTMLEQQTYVKVADVLSKEKISLVNNILNGPDMELG